jgi:hypothetical protein
MREKGNNFHLRVSCVLLKFLDKSTLAQIRADDGKDFHYLILKMNVAEPR